MNSACTLLRCWNWLWFQQQKMPGHNISTTLPGGQRHEVGSAWLRLYTVVLHTDKLYGRKCAELVYLLSFQKLSCRRIEWPFKKYSKLWGPKLKPTFGSLWFQSPHCFKWDCFRAIIYIPLCCVRDAFLFLPSSLPSFLPSFLSFFLSPILSFLVLRALKHFRNSC